MLDAVVVDPTLCTVWRGNDGGDENDLVAVRWEIVMLLNLLIFTLSKVSFAANIHVGLRGITMTRK
jgi:hypothetical protein